MSPLIKNIATALVALSLAYVGYYLYTQNQGSGLDLNGGVDSTEQMLTNTRVFIERRALLDEVTLDTDIFMDPVFQSYRSFRNPEVEAPVGRDNPFSENSTSGS